MTRLVTVLASGSTGQSMGAGVLTIMSVAIMVCLAMLIPIFVANRRPGSPEHQNHRAATRPVLGGMHRGDGRSVAPHRDAPVTYGAAPKRQQPSTQTGRSAER
jgi:hypothetical protein